jgi:hypothetical protein
MDLSDIDEWSRALLQNEARKRGIRTPEMYSRGELAKLILRHDYGSARSVRGAAKMVGGFLGSAKSALRAGLGMAEARREREPARAPVVPVAEARREPAAPPAEPPPARVAKVARAQAPAENTYASPWDEPAPAAPAAPAPSIVEPAAPAALQPAAAEPADFEQLSYGPHPDAGLLLRWRVGSDAIHRARAVLGAHGELALRVITVRVEEGLFVHTDTLDHGPIDSSGDWTAPLEPNAARYVSSVGLRSGDRFVSIVHAASTS